MKRLLLLFGFMATAGNGWAYPAPFNTKPITSTINRAMPALQFCYEKELLTAPTLTGEIIVHFTITPKGVVGVAYAESTLPSDVVGSCVTRVFSALRFPALMSSQRIQLSYPLSFEPLH